jgi:hypothetical protein
MKLGFSMRLLALSTVAFSTAALAREAVHGYGDTRAAAVADATRNVKEASMERFDRADCYTPVRPQDCQQDDGGWICVAYVANHRGSCGR